MSRYVINILASRDLNEIADYFAETRDLLEKAGVVVTPGNAFGEGGEGYVRISLILDCDRLGEALSRLKQAGISFGI